MRHYIGIDLGTTNSSICSYDGENVRVWKSPEQNDVTPSAIFIDKRGNRYYGTKAYNQAPYNPQNSAVLFKRFMGTTTKISFESANLSLTPEECSAEVLKVLFGYLPEEIRNDPETVAVITVPAAFNQMKKDATLQAAKMAGISNVALMQEPVAAIMSIMHKSKKEGAFLVYDLGGGTFDVSIAENIGGKVNLLAHGGIEMCGGRDIDRTIFNKIVFPWLKQNFNIPEDFLINEKYKTFSRITYWAIERAKIELSSMEATSISLNEYEARTLDLDGKEMYLDIYLTRMQIEDVISDLVNETVEKTREIMNKSGLSSNDIERMVFVGGPTNYKPLRDKIAFELSLPGNIDINPMTAVAEGASIFAESIDWTTNSHNRKSANEILKTDIDLSFKYVARTPHENAKVICILPNPTLEYSIQFISLDTGWTSGLADLKDKMMVNLPLNKNGENTFSVKVFNSLGQEQHIGNNTIKITKTLATVGSIPASHSIGVEVINKIGGVSTLEYLVREGDSLPKKGITKFKAGQTLKAGTNDSINIKLWEGEIKSPITDNRFIGVLKISGLDIDMGIIPTGADIECEYEMTDSGNINLEVSVPCIGATFTNRNFYSRQEGQIDLSDVTGIANQGRSLIEKIDDISDKVIDENLDRARLKASEAANLTMKANCDLEDVQKANNDLLEAKKLLDNTRQNNLKLIRSVELEENIKIFDEALKESSSEIEKEQFNNLVSTARRFIENNDSEFDNVLSKIRETIITLLLSKDWYVAMAYKHAVDNPANYIDQSRFAMIKRKGDVALINGDIIKLREALFELIEIQITPDSENGMLDIANIIKG